MTAAEAIAALERELGASIVEVIDHEQAVDARPGLIGGENQSEAAP